MLAKFLKVAWYPYDFKEQSGEQTTLVRRR